MGLCGLCKYLGCTEQGQFKCTIDDEILQHEGQGSGCECFEEYIESEE